MWHTMLTTTVVKFALFFPTPSFRCSPAPPAQRAEQAGARGRHATGRAAYVSRGRARAAACGEVEPESGSARPPPQNRCSAAARPCVELEDRGVRRERELGLREMIKVKAKYTVCVYCAWS